MIWTLIVQVYADNFQFFFTNNPNNLMGSGGAVGKIPGAGPVHHTNNVPWMTEMWTINSYDSDSSFALLRYQTSNCLDAPGGMSTAIMYDCGSTSPSYWYAMQSGNNFVFKLKGSSNSCLGIVDGNSEMGLQNCDIGNGNQAFIVPSGLKTVAYSVPPPKPNPSGAPPKSAVQGQTKTTGVLSNVPVATDSPQLGNQTSIVVNGVTVNGDAGNSTTDGTTNGQTTPNPAVSQQGGASSSSNNLGYIIGGSVFGVVIIAGLGFIVTKYRKTNQTDTVNSQSASYNMQSPYTASSSPHVSNSTSFAGSPTVSTNFAQSPGTYYATSPGMSAGVPEVRSSTHTSINSLSSPRFETAPLPLSPIVAPQLASPAMSPILPPMLINNGVLSPVGQQNYPSSVASPVPSQSQMGVRSPYIPQALLGKNAEQPPLLFPLK
ncbi:hypothetical protein HDV06_002943 [Boothiomyces sp. JEL0866]|nr:hypothetical protein HDV06_002943 [Boothiomyces sp. JEL0866]